MGTHCGGWIFKSLVANARVHEATKILRRGNSLPGRIHHHHPSSADQLPHSTDYLQPTTPSNWITPTKYPIQLTTPNQPPHSNNYPNQLPHSTDYQKQLTTQFNQLPPFNWLPPTNWPIQITTPTNNPIQLSTQTNQPIQLTSTFKEPTAPSNQLPRHPGKPIPNHLPSFEQTNPFDQQTNWPLYLANWNTKFTSSMIWRSVVMTPGS